MSFIEKRPVVYVGHRFNFKEGIWPILVAFLHEKGGYLEEEFPHFVTEVEFAKAFIANKISDADNEKYEYIMATYYNGSYDFIAFEYFRTIAAQFALDVFIYREDGHVLYIDIGLPFNKEVTIKHEENMLCSAETSIRNIDYVLRAQFHELPFYNYCITKSGPQIFYNYPVDEW